MAMSTYSATDDDTPPIEVETGPNPSASIIWLHGLGADGSDFEPMVPELRLPHEPVLRFVFPHAPYRPVTVNGGFIMRAWADMEMTDTGFHQKTSHFHESEGVIRGLIDQEIARGIPAHRIVLAGFSQGGAMALYTGLRYAQRLAGIMVLSAPVPHPGRLMQEAHPANRDVPIFMAHGKHDGVVPFAIGQSTYRLLAAGGATIEWHEYPVEHTVAPAEIKDISRWLLSVLQ
jgi:phospholipase/carboxylesterase